jgi:hypothetical protein
VSTVVRGAVAGVLVGGALTAAAAASGWHDPHEVSEPLASTETAEPAELIEAWRRWRLLSVHVTSTYVRTVNGEVVLRGGDVLAQRPPEEVHRTGGEVVALIDGERIVCTDAVDGRSRCESSGSFDRAALIDAELAGFAEAVGGDDPDYVLGWRDGCFVLTRRVPLLAPPLRDQATYCFDADGVLVVAELRDDVAVDRTEAVEIRPVEDADLTVE